MMAMVRNYCEADPINSGNEKPGDAGIFHGRCVDADPMGSGCYRIGQLQSLLLALYAR